MKHYFIDYENVVESGLEGFEKCKKDKIYVLYSNNSHKINIELLEEGLRKNIKFIKATNLRMNGLDFNIVGLLFQIAERKKLKGKKKEKFYIISKDRGYTSIEDKFKHDYPDYELKFANSIASSNNDENNSNFDNSSCKSDNVTNNIIEISEIEIKKSKVKSVNDFRAKACNKLKLTEIKDKAAIVKIINESTDSGNFHNNLFNTFGNTGRQYYKEIRKQVI